jgi:hypothetical protein
MEQEISDSESITKKKEGGSFFETNWACVLTLRNAPEWPFLIKRKDLRLKKLIQSIYWDIFPPRVFLAQRFKTWIGYQEMNIDPCY